MPLLGEGRVRSKAQTARQGSPDPRSPTTDRTLRPKVPAHSVALGDLCSRKTKEALVHTGKYYSTKKSIFSQAIEGSLRNEIATSTRKEQKILMKYCIE